jgi:hypothetical protein
MGAWVIWLSRTNCHQPRVALTGVWIDRQSPIRQNGRPHPGIIWVWVRPAEGFGRRVTLPAPETIAQPVAVRVADQIDLAIRRVPGAGAGVNRRDPAVAPVGGFSAC